MFKKKYTITEYKNQNGQSKFIVRYCSLFNSLFESFEMFPSYYVSIQGYMVSKFGDIEFSSIESAKEAIENHKIKTIEDRKKQYKKQSIHYVE